MVVQFIVFPLYLCSFGNHYFVFYSFITSHYISSELLLSMTINIIRDKVHVLHVICSVIFTFVCFLLLLPSKTQSGQDILLPWPEVNHVLVCF